MPFEWIEVASDEEARALGLDGLNDPRLPMCEFPDGTRMEHPTIRQITEKLGWFRDPSRSEYDIAIYGPGRPERGRLQRLRRLQNRRDRAMGGWRSGEQQPQN
jgi:hypothetical protein